MRLPAAILAVLMAAACAGGGGTKTPAAQIKVTGGVNTTLRTGSTSYCSLSDLGPQSSLVFNGAVTPKGQPSYALLFSVFPYKGKGAYEIGATGTNSQVQLIDNATGQILKADSGTIRVDQASATRATGRVDAQLRGADLSAITTTASAKGDWSCQVRVPAPRSPVP